MPGDIADDGFCRELVQKTVDEFGRIDILVNNAAYQGKEVEKFEDIDAERVRAHAAHQHRRDVLVEPVTRVPHMQAGGAIINTASIKAYQPTPAILDYASTKGAIVTFTKGLGQELAKRGIRVNAVAPGPVWTPLIVQSFPAEKVESFGTSTPLGRPAQPADLAPAYVFLASDDSRFMTGEVIGLTGGELMG